MKEKKLNKKFKAIIGQRHGNIGVKDKETGGKINFYERTSNGTKICQLNKKNKFKELIVKNYLVYVHSFSCTCCIYLYILYMLYIRY